MISDFCGDCLGFWGHDAVVYPHARDAMIALDNGEISLDQNAGGIVGAFIDFQNIGPSTPNSGGGELAKYFQREHPEFPIIIMTGNIGQLKLECPDLEVAFLSKPITVQEFKLAVDNMLASKIPNSTSCGPEKSVGGLNGQPSAPALERQPSQERPLVLIL